MTRRRSFTIAAALLGLVALGLASCGGRAIEAADRTVYMAAIEPKGTTNVAKEAFPTQPLPAGGGYALKEPYAAGDWTVETYRWLPSTVTVAEGDRVTLEILGINGASHPTQIEGYNLDFEVKRGQLTTVKFTADDPGIFRFRCKVHQPAMTGTLVVLPK